MHLMHREPRNIISDLAVRARYHFTSSELRSVLGASDAAARQALSRLAAKGEIASPARGFYVIVPPRVSAARLPAGGSVHSRADGAPGAPGTTCGLALRPRSTTARPIIVRRNSKWCCTGTARLSCAGAVRSRLSRAVTSMPFRSRVSTIPVERFWSRPWRRRRSISVGYMHRAGGVDRVAGVLLELATTSIRNASSRRRNPGRSCGRNAWATSWSMSEPGDRTALLKEHVRKHARNFTKLLPGAGAEGCAAVQGLAAFGERKHRDGSVIPRDYITQWRERAPWSEDFQVEQDLVISRALRGFVPGVHGARGRSGDARDVRAESWKEDRRCAVQCRYERASQVGVRVAAAGKRLGRYPSGSSRSFRASRGKGEADDKRGLKRRCREGLSRGISRCRSSPGIPMSPQSRAMPEGTCMTAEEFEAGVAPLRWSEFATLIGLNSRRR